MGEFPSLDRTEGVERANSVGSGKGPSQAAALFQRRANFGEAGAAGMSIAAAVRLGSSAVVGTADSRLEG